MDWIRDVITKGLASWLSRHKLDRTPSQPLPSVDAPAKAFLHVGCGYATKPHVAKCFLPDDWREIRLDIDPSVSPHIVASMLDMTPVADEAVDAVYSAHNIEHLYPHEVPVAFREFLRVLKPGGFLVLTCPDLQSIGRLVAEDRLTEAIYHSSVGPITPLDVLYGHRPQLAAGNLFMAHHSGFTLRSLVESLRAEGFASVAGRRRDEQFDLWVVATKAPSDSETLSRMLEECLPDA